ncbi:type VI secretion system protein TssA [Pantoea piersonii]|uniref:type VI secretion system protein TssA n=1 Tax=Pantoea piersonii TaxID=2364647 RepID=UPI0028A77713|nr:type VI secretion system protein TssA [Pantoea piersonii]
MNPESLLSPLRDDAPCGDNLEYDAQFMALEQACVGKSEQQFGSTIIPAEAPDWQAVEKAALALHARTRDVRVMLILTEAWTHIRGLEGFAQGVTLLTQALERYWLSLYPPLEYDGEPDPLLRINALSALSGHSNLINALRQCWLIKSSTGEIALRDAVALADGSKSDIPDFPGGLARLRDEFAAPDHPGVGALQTLAQQLPLLRDTLTQHLSPGDLPDLSAVEKIVALLLPLCPARPVAPAAEAVEEAGDDEIAAAGQQAAPAQIAWHQAALHSRADVELMLEKIKTYFHQHEPSHPAPIMLERVQRLIQMDFMNIIRDLAPEAVSQLNGVFGQPGQ